jgi:hypothetical protein
MIKESRVPSGEKEFFLPPEDTTVLRNGPCQKMKMDLKTDAFILQRVTQSSIPIKPWVWDIG